MSVIIELWEYNDEGIRYNIEETDVLDVNNFYVITNAYGVENIFVFIDDKYFLVSKISDKHYVIKSNVFYSVGTIDADNIVMFNINNLTELDTLNTSLNTKSKSKFKLNKSIVFSNLINDTVTPVDNLWILSTKKDALKSERIVCTILGDLLFRLILFPHKDFNGGEVTGTILMFTEEHYKRPIAYYKDGELHSGALSICTIEDMVKANLKKRISEINLDNSLTKVLKETSIKTVTKMADDEILRNTHVINTYQDEYDLSTTIELDISEVTMKDIETYVNYKH